MHDPDIMYDDIADEGIALATPEEWRDATARALATLARTERAEVERLRAEVDDLLSQLAQLDQLWCGRDDAAQLGNGGAR